MLCLLGTCSFSWYNLEISKKEEAEGAGAVQLREVAERDLINCVNICREGSEHGAGSSQCSSQQNRSQRAGADAQEAPPELEAELLCRDQALDHTVPVSLTGDIPEPSGHNPVLSALG